MVQYDATINILANQNTVASPPRYPQRCRRASAARRLRIMIAALAIDRNLSIMRRLQGGVAIRYPKMLQHRTLIAKALLCGVFLASAPAVAGPVYQPPGANLVFGDVAHGQRSQSAVSNPAAAAADVSRGAEILTRGTVLSLSAGIDYGNVQELFDFYDSVTKAYAPGIPGDDGVGPGHFPEGGGIKLGDIWDSLDPDFQATVSAVALEVATQAALLAIIKKDAYAKAWVAADAPFVLGGEHLGGTWTYGVNWSGTSKAFGLVQPIDFDPDEALTALEDWWNTLPISRPRILPVSNDVLLRINPATNAVNFAINNDSSMLTKATQTTELNLGYSRHAWSNSKGSLFLGAEARLYMMRLSRLSVRLGDIKDAEQVFDAIRNSNFRSDTRLGVDVGALWVGGNYQLGAQVTNVNEPRFVFPDVDLDLYSNDGVIGFLQQDQVYRMNRQFKFEASLFSTDRRWSAHLGLDAEPAMDPMGDEYQWVTVSGGWSRDSWWLPGLRIGYRENLAGTERKYVGLGVTAFKIVNFDIASSLGTVSIDGKTLPQGLMGSIGFALSW